MEQAIWLVGRGALLLVVILLPWFFGGVYMSARAGLTLALFVPLVCAAALWKNLAKAWGPVAFSLGIFAAALLLASWQLTTTASHVSTAAAELRSEFAADSPQTAPEAPLSLHPPATRRDLALLIAVAASFALGALFFSDPKSLLLLMGALATNGAVLSVWGLLQRASSQPWSYGGMTAPNGTQPFGPFISRNNAGGFLCICLAAALGMLVWRVRKLLHRTLAERQRGHASWATIALDTGVLAIATGAVVLLAGIIATLSRGSMLAAFAGTVTAVLLLAVTSRSTAYFWPMVLGGAVALGFVLWLGQGEDLAGRWSGIAESGIDNETRPQLWRESLQAVKTYGLFGSGFGTFYYAHAPFQRHLSLGQYRYGENQFIEAIVVGGYVGLGLLLLLGMRCFAAVRLLLKNAVSSAEVAIAFGGACLLLIQVICACFDFGWYLPALAIPMSLWCGGLVRISADSANWPSKIIKRKRRSASGGAGSAANPAASASASATIALPESPPPPPIPPAAARPGVRSAISTPAIAAVLTILFAGLAWASQISRVATIVEEADYATRRLLSPDASPSIAEIDDAVQTQSTAVVAEPDNGEAIVRLAELRAKRYQLESGRSALQLYAAAALAERIGNATELRRLREEPASQRFLIPALEECRRAQAACPFNYFVHLLTAQLCFLDGPPEAAEAALERAERLAQGRSDWLYLLGAMQLEAARPAAAWKAWRRACELRPGLCEQAFPIAESFLGSAEALQRVVPDNPRIIIELVDRHLSDRSMKERSRYYLKAVELIEATEKQSPELSLLRGIALAELGKLDAAETAIAQALREDQARGEWYFELACVQAALGKTTLADIAFSRYELLTGYHGKTAATYKRRAADLIRNRPQHEPDDWKRSGELYLAAGATAEAVAVYRQAVAEFPLNGATHGGLATALLTAGDAKGALESASQAIALEPHQQAWDTILRRAKEAVAAKSK